jgi:hypothetical protein
MLTDDAYEDPDEEVRDSIDNRDPKGFGNP